MHIYRTTRDVARIDVCEVERTTDAQVFLLDPPGRRVKRKGQTVNYHDTWEEAHTFLKARAEQRLKTAQTMELLARKFADDVISMGKP